MYIVTASRTWNFNNNAMWNTMNKHAQAWIWQKIHETHTLKTASVAEMEDLTVWRHIPCSWTGKVQVAKVLIFPTFIYRSIESGSKFQQDFPVSSNWQSLKLMIPKIHMEVEKTWSGLSNLKRVGWEGLLWWANNQNNMVLI